MDEREWRALLNQFDIYVREKDDGRFFNVGRVLRYHGEGIPGLYLNLNRHGQTYLTARQEDEGCYPDRLWDWIDAGRLKQKGLAPHQRRAQARHEGVGDGTSLGVVWGWSRASFAPPSGPYSLLTPSQGTATLPLTKAAMASS